MTKDKLTDRHFTMWTFLKMAITKDWATLQSKVRILHFNKGYVRLRDK